MNDARGSRVVFSIKEEQVHADGIARENAEVHAAIDDGRADWGGLACGRCSRCFLFRESWIVERRGPPHPNPLPKERETTCLLSKKSGIHGLNVLLHPYSFIPQPRYPRISET